MDLRTRDLVEIGFDLVETEPGAPSRAPIDLGRRVLAAARASRPVRHEGWAATAHDGLTPLDSFIRTAAEFGDLLGGLSMPEWEAQLPTPGGTATELVRHLTGIERYLLGQLGRGPRVDAPHREDHYPVSARLTADLEGASADDLARTWWLAALEVVSAAGELGPDQPATFHHLPGTLRGLLVVRTFELWSHGDDIRRGTGRRLSELDGARLALMSNQLMHVLGVGMALSGTAQPGRSARVTLTGPGGSEFEVALAPDELPGPPDIVIRTSALELCRVAANRLAFDRLRAEVSGDATLLEPILVGAAAFAAD